MVLRSSGGVDKVAKRAIQLTSTTLGVRSRRSKGNDITILSLRISCAHNRKTTPSRTSAGKSRRPSGGSPAVIQVRAWSVIAGGLTDSDLILCVKFAILVNGFGVGTFRDRGALPPTSVLHLSYDFPLAMRGCSGSCRNTQDLRPLISLEWIRVRVGDRRAKEWKQIKAQCVAIPLRRPSAL